MLLFTVFEDVTAGQDGQTIIPEHWAAWAFAVRGRELAVHLTTLTWESLDDAWDWLLRLKPAATEVPDPEAGHTASTMPAPAVSARGKTFIEW
jgi:hypothetical protein